MRDPYSILYYLCLCCNGDTHPIYHQLWRWIRLCLSKFTSRDLGVNSARCCSLPLHMPATCRSTSAPSSSSPCSSRIRKCCFKIRYFVLPDLALSIVKSLHRSCFTDHRARTMRTSHEQPPVSQTPSHSPLFCRLQRSMARARKAAWPQGSAEKMGGGGGEGAPRVGSGSFGFWPDKTAATSAARLSAVSSRDLPAARRSTPSSPSMPATTSMPRKTDADAWILRRTGKTLQWPGSELGKSQRESLNRHGRKTKQFKSSISSLVRGAAAQPWCRESEPGAKGGRPALALPPARRRSLSPPRVQDSTGTEPSLRRALLHLSSAVSQASVGEASQPLCRSPTGGWVLAVGLWL